MLLVAPPGQISLRKYVLLTQLDRSVPDDRLRLDRRQECAWHSSRCHSQLLYRVSRWRSSYEAAFPRRTLLLEPLAPASNSHKVEGHKETAKDAITEVTEKSHLRRVRPVCRRERKTVTTRVVAGVSAARKEELMKKHVLEPSLF